jgi:hypothetical protein
VARIHRALKARTPRIAAVTALVGGLLAFGVQPAGASADPITHPERDWLGSQVAKHEPGRGNLVLRPNVTQTPGLDVSSWQGNVNWSNVAANGAKFAYVKATESTNYTNPYFSQQKIH